MTNIKIAKNRQKFYCENCDHGCNKLSDYNKHLLTRKHKILTNPNEKIAEVAKAYICPCGKSYKHASSLSGHKKKCLYKEETEDIDYKLLLLKMMEQNKELQNTIITFYNNYKNL